MTIARRAFVAAFLFVLVLLPRPATAQAEAEPPAEDKSAEAPAAEEPSTVEPANPGRSTLKPHAWGNIELDLAAWLANPAGTNFRPAAYINPSAANQLTYIDVPSEHEIVQSVRLGLILPKNIGTLSGRYASFSQQVSMVRSNPGDFNYAELQVVPFGAGVFENGFADGFESKTRMGVRDWTIDFRRTAYDSPRFEGTWHAGIRGVSFLREMYSSYYALNPSPLILPPVIFPNTPSGGRPDLAPAVDTAHTQSEFDGRGVDVGLDFRFPISKSGAFTFEGGFSMGLIWGNLTTQYASVTSSYLFTDPESGDSFFLLPSEYIFLLDPAIVAATTQVPLPLALTDESGQSAATVLEGYLGCRVRVARGMELFFGFRDVRYDDTATEVRLGAPSSLPSGQINFVSEERTPISTTFDGFYFGLGFTY